jgi:hypothetical protein
MDQPSCAICGKPIEAGQAWMEAEEAGRRLVAHAGCVYRDAPSPQSVREWTPGDGDGPGA